mgnify:CR=1 FL=1
MNLIINNNKFYFPSFLKKTSSILPNDSPDALLKSKPIIFTLFFSTNFEDLISIRIAIGSGVAFLVAQLIDVQIFDQLRKKKWFIAPITSSFIGSTVDTFALTVAIAGTATVGTLAAASATAANLSDGVHPNVYTNSVTAAATSTLTATPQGTLGGLGVKTLTVTTVAASTFATAVATVATSTTNVVGTNVAAPSLSAMNNYKMAPSQTSFTFDVTGLTPSTSFTYDITATPVITVNGAAYTSGADTTAIASATGTATFVIVATTPADTNTVVLDINNAGTTNIAGQVNATVTYTAPVYAVTLSSPTATSLTVTGSTLTYVGSIADQYGNKLGGATVTATGTNTIAAGNTTSTATT